MTVPFLQVVITEDALAVPDQRKIHSPVPGIVSDRDEKPFSEEDIGLKRFRGSEKELKGIRWE